MDFDLSHLVLPAGFRLGDFQWVKLHALWGGVRGGVEVRWNHVRDNMAVDVIERLPSSCVLPGGVPAGDRVSFWYVREVVGSFKFLHVDYFGLVGLSRLNLDDRTVIITEGVSDYLSASLAFPARNVLGFLSPGGSRRALRVVLSLFDDVTYCCDNDCGSSSGVNTGQRIGARVVHFFKRHGKSVRLWSPSYPHKDLTDEFMASLVRVSR